MKKHIMTIVFVLGILTCSAQSPEPVCNTFRGGYTMSAHDLFERIARQFGVKLRVDVDTVGVKLSYAESRIRPYSVEETLGNVLKPLGMRYEKKGDRNFIIRPFHYPRRTFDEGISLISWLSTLYSDKEMWEARRDSLLPAVRELLGIDALLRSRVKDARPSLGKLRKHDGYKVQNFRLETLPGKYVCGSIYMPIKKGVYPVIICPNGHFKDGRYNDEQQLRKGTLARMGAIVVDYDLIGYGENTDIHETPEANVMQLVNGLCILDYMLTRNDVDHTRVGLNGGSGGGTQVIYLGLLDDRFTAACPVVSLGAHFDGGCPCESGLAATRAIGGTCHPEIAACFAPKPMCVVSDSGDWTANVPINEYPYLQMIYGFYGKTDAISNVHLQGERHDFGPNKRKAVYAFFADVFDLDVLMIDEAKVTIETAEQMKSYN